MRFILPPVRPPRHPLARIALAVVGIALFGALLVFGLVALAVIVIAGGVLMLMRAWQQRKSPRRQSRHQQDEPEVLEGEYVVVHERRHASHH